MSYANLIDENSQIGDGQALIQIQRNIKQKIEKAKNYAADLKINQDNQQQFQLTATGELIYPTFRPEVNYNQQFWKTYVRNELSFNFIKQLSQNASTLQTQIKQIQNLQQQYFRLYKIKNRKKNRRLAVEIQKNYECPYEKCYKYYGSDVSLNLHIKLKHNGGNKTDRQKLAQQICLAQLNGTPMPEMRYTLPPGYLQEYKKQNKFLQKQIQKNK